ncbi:hypothetical protein [Actinoalloteichus caeruleus]|uniref:hypothetical protein n=1 Tax=Actinoalloteichus cyanogriseus TaxID=2893586 RepID=UPI0004AB7E62|nr:hypothetical protein [Actinoalloteichus caeruleus]
MAREEDGELIPLNPPFDVVYRGFHRTQVLDYVRSLEGDLRIIAADRDAALSQCADLRNSLELTRRDLDQAREAADRMVQEPVSAATLSERLQRMLALAESEADALRAQADEYVVNRRAEAERERDDLCREYEGLVAGQEEHRRQVERDYERRVADMAREYERRYAGMLAEAEAVLADAKAKAEQRVSDATAAAEQTVAEATTTAERMVAEATATAEGMVAEATRRCTHIESSSAARRRQVEKDFEIAMAKRRSDAARRLREHEAEVERRLHARTRQVDDHVENRLRHAQDREDEVRDAQRSALAQFEVARRLLDQAADSVHVLPERRDAARPSRQPSDARPTPPAEQGTVGASPPADLPARATTGPASRDQAPGAVTDEAAEEGDDDAPPARQQPGKSLAAQSAKKNRNARARSRRPAKSRR